MSNFKDKTVWITGASSGIGKALALALANQGARLILSARNESALEEIKKDCGENGKSILIKAFDLANAEALESAAKDVLERVERLDYVFLNGGLSQRSMTQDTPIEIDRKLMDVNYFGAIMLVKKTLPYFLKQGFGHYVVTSSITGEFGFSMRSAYSASKHALHGYFDSLRSEHTKNNIKVTIACPGFIQTDISVNALGPDGKAQGKMDVAQKNGMSAETCARKMISAALKNKKYAYIGRSELLMVYFKRYLPFVYYKLAANLKRN